MGLVLQEKDPTGGRQPCCAALHFMTGVGDIFGEVLNLLGVDTIIEKVVT